MMCILIIDGYKWVADITYFMFTSNRESWNRFFFLFVIISSSSTNWLLYSLDGIKCSSIMARTDLRLDKRLRLCWSKIMYRFPRHRRVDRRFVSVFTNKLISVLISLTSIVRDVSLKCILEFVFLVSKFFSKSESINITLTTEIHFDCVVELSPDSSSILSLLEKNET